MTEAQLTKALDALLKLDSETEVVEFKEAKENFDFGKLGKYFSALANEANLNGKTTAWLIFGVVDKGHKVIGSKFRSQRVKLDSLKGEIAAKTTNRITFKEIYEVSHANGRVIMFEIPAAPKGIPIAFEGHYYGRDGEELSPLNLEEIERIRGQAIDTDWSAVKVSNATIDDLDPLAIKVARENFKSKFPEKGIEVDTWDDITFLNKAKITIQGKITRTAIILLGREESEHFINPAEAKIRWVLKDEYNNDKDYEIFSCPMILAVDKVYAKIRNLKYRYIAKDSLFPEEVLRFEPFVIREALNNCIAHQDYSLGARINVIEIGDDKLVFTNYGSFIPGTVEKVVMDDAPEEHYRNRFLATAMFNVKMVDTAGGGIKKMFNYQRKRFFPMPEYDFSGNKVTVTIIGKVLDIDFAVTLAQHQNLSLEDVILLDRVQKSKPINAQEAKYLRAKNLIEGRKPNYFISIGVAQKVGQKAAYSKNKGFDKKYYCDLIEKAVSEHGSMSRKEINDLLWNKLPELLSEKQKGIKINNLISEMRKKCRIKNIGNAAKPVWVTDCPF